LRDELQSFARKISETGRVSYDAKSGQHDDTISAICIALFMANNRQRGEFSVEPLNF
jgi:hypothetical protein